MPNRWATIGSLAYFLPVIEEVQGLRVSPNYFQYLRHKLQRTAPTRQTPARARLGADAGNQPARLRRG